MCETNLIGDISDGNKRMPLEDIRWNTVRQRQTENDPQPGCRSFPNGVAEPLPDGRIAKSSADPNRHAFAAAWQSYLPDLPKEIGHEDGTVGPRLQIQLLQ